MNKYTVYTEFMHSKTVYLTFNLKQMIFQSLESEKSFSAQKRTKLVKNVFRTAKRRERKARKRLFWIIWWKSGSETVRQMDTRTLLFPDSHPIFHARHEAETCILTPYFHFRITLCPKADARESRISHRRDNRMHIRRSHETLSQGLSGIFHISSACPIKINACAQ